MQTITFKCPDKLANQLQGESVGTKMAKSDIVRRAIEFYLTQKGHTTKPASIYLLSQDLCGSIDGPEDLSENPAHLEGYGE
jgi:hypothetical protein